MNTPPPVFSRTMALTSIHITSMNEDTATVVPASQEIKLSKKDITRFWSKVDKNGPTMPHMKSHCWLWTAATNSRGYGQFWAAGRQVRANRAAWMIANNSISCGLYVCHSCDTPTCVNPSHLFLGTHIDNVRDRDSKGRQAKGDKNGMRLYRDRLPRGDNHHARLHPERLARGESVGNAKLNTATVLVMRALHAAGGNGARRLAKRFGISRSTAEAVIRRTTWKHI